MKNNVFNRKSLTVGIAAHNEENNIESIIRQVLAQKGNFVLDNILVEVDGSTDGTLNIVKQMAMEEAIIKLNPDLSWVGKSARLNNMFEASESDVFVILDADILLEGEHVFDKLIAGFANETVGIVSSNNQPLQGNNFWSRVTQIAEDLWYESRKDFNGGVCIYNNSGCCVALSKNFYKSFKMPVNTIGDQHVIYLNLIRKNLRFVFMKEAIVYYATADNLKDILSQLSRSSDAEEFELENLGKSYAQEFVIPIPYKINAIIKLLLRDPIFTLVSIACLSALKFIRLKSDPINLKGLWNPIMSTKRRLG